MNRQRLRDQLIADEGVVFHIYEDHLGYATFGVGHLITKDDPEWGVPLGTSVDKERVWEVFEKDIDKHIRECYSLYTEGNFKRFPGEVQEILVNMMFNLGRTRLSKFVRMNAAIHEHDWKEAAKEGRDSRWYEQVTNRAERLMKRLEKV